MAVGYFGSHSAFVIQLKMLGLPSTEGHSAHEVVGPSLSKTGQFLTSGSRNASARRRGLASAHPSGRVDPHTQHPHQKGKPEILCGTVSPLARIILTVFTTVCITSPRFTVLAQRASW